MFCQIFTDPLCNLHGPQWPRTEFEKPLDPSTSRLKTGKNVLPVNADHAKVHDAGRAANDIEADVYVAHHGPEQPFARRVVDDRQGQNNKPHQKVRQSQRHDQVVGRLTQLLYQRYRNDDEAIADHDDQR